ncbi:MAG: hypothetical protein ACOYT8_03800 [Candidatus Dependentiae bacterium]
MKKTLLLLFFTFSINAQLSFKHNRLTDWIIKGILTKNEEIQKTIADAVTICGEPKVLKIIDIDSLRKKIVILEQLCEQLKIKANQCDSKIEEKVVLAKNYQLNISSWESAEKSHCWTNYIQLAYHIETLKSLQHAIEIESFKK